MGCEGLNCEGEYSESRKKPNVECLREGDFGRGGIGTHWSSSVMRGQSVSSQGGLGRKEGGVGGWTEIRMGTWSDPVKGSYNASI